jgi:flagellar assembly factor FliW
MRVTTRPYGEIEIDERQRIRLPLGLLGFEDLRDWALLDATQPPFYWLQSLERTEVAFVLIDPLSFRSDYEPGADPAELAGLELAGPQERLVFAIVTVPAEAGRMSANLQGPLIVNRQTRVGRQVVSLDPRWGVRHVIADELAARRAAAC